MYTYRETTRRFGVMQLTVAVGPRGIDIEFGPLPRSRRHIPVDDLQNASVAVYQASRYGGWHWGMRTAPGGNAVYRLRGGHGVELTLAGGRHVFLGSDDAHGLHAAIVAISRPQ